MNNTNVAVCHYCGNKVPLEFLANHIGKKLYEEFEQRKFYENFEIILYKCPTCDGISVYADFEEYPNHKSLAGKRVYPPGAKLMPESHKVWSKNCVPQKLQNLYDEIAPLRHIAPNAFVGQVRRALEFICKDQEAQGNSLFDQLNYLISKGSFSGHFVEVINLMRRAGNLGSHLEEADIDMWAAELIDDFFIAVVDYLYVMPSKIDRLKRRLISNSE